MKIVADENNPFVVEAFSTLGEVVALPGKEITREVLQDAQALICRSTVPINADLLEGTNVRFVGTATIGTDHFDTAYMDSQGIHYCNAAGCNADSVADYLSEVLLVLSEKTGESLEGKTLAVIGCGNVGSRVVQRAVGLGMHVIQNDPPLARKTGDPVYRPLEDVFDADILTLHTPLTQTGEHATFHMVDEAFIGKMKKDAILINASRGAVVDTQALDKALSSGRIADAVLDVWENEPLINTALADLVYLATPHIAGHSFDGKVNGTSIIYQALCEWLNQKPEWEAEPHLPLPEFAEIEIDAEGKEDEEALLEAVSAVYPIFEDDERFRTSLEREDPEERAAAFRSQRKHYPVRREFRHSAILLKNGRAVLESKFQALTFSVRNL